MILVRLIRVVPVIAVAAIGSALVLDASSPLPASSTVVAGLFPGGFGCNSCRECGDFGHEHYISTNNALNAFFHAWKDPGESCKHSVCNRVQPEHIDHHDTHTHDPTSIVHVDRDLDWLQERIAMSDPATLADVKAGANEYVRFDEARQAIQVIGCMGQVVAHFPVEIGIRGRN